LASLYLGHPVCYNFMFELLYLLYFTISIVIRVQTLLEIDELLKYLDHAENELNSAESISPDPETLALQLAQHKVTFIFFTQL